MSNSVGRLLIASHNRDFSVDNVTNSAWTQIESSLSESASRCDITNTSTDVILVGLGAAASEATILQVGPGATLSIQTLAHQGQRVSIKSVFSATLSSGKLALALYK